MGIFRNSRVCFLLGGHKTMQVLLSIILTIAVTNARAGEYTLGADSKPQKGVPQGTVQERILKNSGIYPGTTTEYWVYVPVQYNSNEPACVMVFQDGQTYVNKKGPVRVPTVFDNLIHRGEIPVTIGIFINPGTKKYPYDQRDVQYVTMDDTYARFLLEEIIPQVSKDYNLVDNASGRAIAGMSDGGLVSFTVAWERPDSFSKVISHIGSYTRLRGGSEYPYLIRQTRGNQKPIRIFLQDGSNDLNITQGNWTLANLSMASALMFARYDYRLEMGTGGHDLGHGGAIFPDTLRWIWRDYPHPKKQELGLKTLAGIWDVVTNRNGQVSKQELFIGIEQERMNAILKDEQGKEIKVSGLTFKDDILSYAYSSHTESKEGGRYKNTQKFEQSMFVTWLKVKSDTFEGSVSPIRGKKGRPNADYSVKGSRRTM
ncbi:MAG: alpha/beta hydrolase [Candidatus Azotimanducaceae bacterium]